MDEISESILNSVKKLLGYPVDLTNFDTDIMIHINGAFGTLQQRGYGPEDGYYITGPDNIYNEFLSDPTDINMLKPYLYLKTKLAFDPPSTSFVLESIKEQISEYEFRLAIKGSEMKRREEKIQNGE